MTRPEGIPPAESSARRRLSEPDEPEETTGPLRSLRPPAKDDAKSDEPAGDAPPPAAPPGLKNMTTSARLRLELALDHDDDDDERRPQGLSPMTTSARQRLELALEHDDDVDIRPPNLPRERLSQTELGAIPFDDEARRVIRSLQRWVAFCGLITLTLGALTGLSYLTGPGSIAHVVVGILASAVSIWLLAAAWSFRRVLTARQQRHHLIHALGHIRSALLLKAVLVFAAMVLGCFTFSIAGSLLFLLG